MGPTVNRLWRRLLTAVFGPTVTIEARVYRASTGQWEDKRIVFKGRSRKWKVGASGDSPN